MGFFLNQIGVSAQTGRHSALVLFIVERQPIHFMVVYTIYQGIDPFSVTDTFFYFKG